MVSLLAALCGFVEVKKSSLILPLRFVVRNRYSFSVEETQSSGTSVYFGRKSNVEALPGLVVLRTLLIFAQKPSAVSWSLSIQILDIV